MCHESAIPDGALTLTASGVARRSLDVNGTWRLKAPSAQCAMAGPVMFFVAVPLRAPLDSCCCFGA